MQTCHFQGKTPPVKKKILIDLIGLLCISLIIVVGYKLSPLLLPKADVTIRPDPICDLHRQACTVSPPAGGTVELAMGAHPIPMVKPFRISVTTRNFSPSRVAVDFAGLEMNMGFNRVELASHNDGSHVGEASLPVCITGQMEWQATVLIETGSERIAIPYRFVSASHA